MKLLVFYPYIPYPLDRGTYQRTFHLLRELAREHTVDLLALSENGERMEHRAVFEGFCRKVHLVPFQHPAWPRLFPERLFNATPTSVLHWRSPEVAEALRKVLAEEQYDAVHVCDIVLADYFLKEHVDVPLVVDRSRVDLLFQITQYRLMAKGWYRKLLDAECLAKMWLYEKRVARRVDAQIVCGPDDETFLRAHVSKTVPVHVLANGVDLQFFDPRTVRVPRDPNPTVLFCGAMDYTPNVDALRWYFQEIHERLASKVPDLKVMIVGKAPTPEVKAYASIKGVTVTGGVPDVRPFYRYAWMQMVPLRIGGGTRLKIVESLAMGTPVISTTIGAQGLDLMPEYDVLLADEAADFAEQTAQALLNPALRQCMERAGKETAQERFGWPTLGEQLNAFYRAFHPRQKQQTTPVNDLISPFPLGASHRPAGRAV